MDEITTDRPTTRNHGHQMNIVFDWPARRNAIDYQAWGRAGHGDGRGRRRRPLPFRVVTLTGADPAFCAGVKFGIIDTSIGAAFAKDLVLTGRVIGAEEALAEGIVSRVVAHDDLGALPWPSAYFAMVATDTGQHLNSRRAADREGIVDQVMLRTDDVWGRIEAFRTSKGLKGYRA